MQKPLVIFRVQGTTEHKFYRLWVRFTKPYLIELTAVFLTLNPLTPNDHYSGRTAPLTSKRCILYIYATNIGTECFEHGIYSPFFYLQNAVCFIILTYLVPVLLTFYIQGVLKLKINNSGSIRLMNIQQRISDQYAEILIL